MKPAEGGKMKFQYKFKYFPENVADEVIQDVTLRLLFKQVRHIYPILLGFVNEIRVASGFLVSRSVIDSRAKHERKLGRSRS